MHPVPLRKFFQQRGLGSVHVTVGKFYRPSGASTQLKGVVPDIILPSETDLPDVGESRLPNALAWYTIPSTTYTPLAGLGPLLRSLCEKSQARVAADPAFRLVREELAMAKKHTEAKWLSLNEADRQREKAKTDEIETELKNIAHAKAVQRAPAQHLTLADIDFARFRPVGQTAQTSAAITNSEETNPDGDIQLGEAENILADYIHAIRTPAAVLKPKDQTQIQGEAKIN